MRRSRSQSWTCHYGRPCTATLVELGQRQQHQLINFDPHSVRPRSCLATASRRTREEELFPVQAQFQGIVARRQMSASSYAKINLGEQKLLRFFRAPGLEEWHNTSSVRTSKHGDFVSQLNALTKNSTDCFVTNPDVEEFTSSTWVARPQKTVRQCSHSFDYNEKRREMEISQKIARIYNFQRPIDKQVNKIIQARENRKKQFAEQLQQSGSRRGPDKQNEFNKTFFRPDNLKRYDYVRRQHTLQ